MKTPASRPGRALAAVLLLLLSLAAAPLPAQEKAKAPVDVAWEAFVKLRDDKEAAVTPERLTAILDAGLNVVAAHPTHWRAASTIASLATHAGKLREKRQAPLRDYWMAQVRYQVVNRRTARDQTDEQLAAWAALDAALAGFEARQAPGRETIAVFREKIDRLQEQPKAGLFLSGQERDYLVLLFDVGMEPAAEAHARRLAEAKDRKVAEMARDELAYLAARREPLALAFTGLDGAAFDLASLRGRPVLLVFWSAKTPKFDEQVDALKELTVRVRELAIVMVSGDKEPDRAAVAEFVKRQRVRWPVLFDGDGLVNDPAARLNVRALPAMFLLDAQGRLASRSLRVGDVEWELKKLQARR
jgi:peroxiredoxin